MLFLVIKVSCTRLSLLDHNIKIQFLTTNLKRNWSLDLTELLCCSNLSMKIFKLISFPNEILTGWVITDIILRVSNIIL